MVEVKRWIPLPDGNPKFKDPEYQDFLTRRRQEVAAERLAAGNPIKPDRTGTPNGMNAAQAKWFRRQAKFEASLTMKKLEKAGVLDDADDMAKDALHTALTIMRMEGHMGHRLAAARLVLDFTKAKPAQKQELTISKAEDWLEAVVIDAQEAITDQSSDSSA